MSTTTVKKPDAASALLDGVPLGRRRRPSWQLIVCVILGILGVTIALSMKLRPQPADARTQ